MLVTPFAGVWIEIQDKAPGKAMTYVSLPSRECGLKCKYSGRSNRRRNVTPFAGVWIEIIQKEFQKELFNVTPFAGVWIEISSNRSIRKAVAVSLPSRECGLKWRFKQSTEHRQDVTPFAGVWIEMWMFEKDTG